MFISHSEKGDAPYSKSGRECMMLSAGPNTASRNDAIHHRFNDGDFGTAGPVLESNAK